MREPLGAYRADVVRGRQIIQLSKELTSASDVVFGNEHVELFGRRRRLEGFHVDHFVRVAQLDNYDAERCEARITA